MTTQNLSNPQFTTEASKKWNEIPLSAQNKILENVWCSHCCRGVHLSLMSAIQEGNSLILQGTCKTCSGKVCRVIEFDNDTL